MLPLKLSPEMVPLPMMLALPKLKAPTSGLKLAKSKVPLETLTPPLLGKALAAPKIKVPPLTVVVPV